MNRNKKQQGRGRQKNAQVHRSPLEPLSFMDGYLMALTVMGQGRAEVLEHWRATMGEHFGDLTEEYLALKPDIDEAVYFTEDFIRSAAEIESWMVGLALALLADDGFGQQVEALEGEVQFVALDLLIVLEASKYAGPLQLPPVSDPEFRAVWPRMQERWTKFQAEMRGLGMRKRIDYLGDLLGLIEGIVHGKLGR